MVVFARESVFKGVLKEPNPAHLKGTSQKWSQSIWCSWYSGLKREPGSFQRFSGLRPFIVHATTSQEPRLESDLLDILEDEVGNNDNKSSLYEKKKNTSTTLLSSTASITVMLVHSKHTGTSLLSQITRKLNYKQTHKWTDVQINWGSYVFIIYIYTHTDTRVKTVQWFFFFLRLIWFP